MNKSLTRIFSCLPVALLFVVTLLIVVSLQVYWLGVWEDPNMKYRFPIDQKESASSLSPAIIDSKIQIEESYISPCRGQGTDQRFWGAFVVSNGYPDVWIQGQGDLRFLDDFGNLLGKVDLEFMNYRQNTPVYYDLVIPANGDSLFVYPNLLYRGLTFGLDFQESMNTTIKFNRLEFYAPYPLQDPDNWHLDVLHFGVEEKGYPKHTLDIRADNKSQNKYYRVKVTALIFNHHEELIDILFSEKVGAWQRGAQIIAGDGRDFKLNSLSNSGACVGVHDDNQKHALISLKFLNAVGTPGESLFWIDLPK